MKRHGASNLIACLATLGLVMASCGPAAAPPPAAKAVSPAPAATKAPAPPVATATGAQPAAKAAPPGLTPKSASEQPRYGGILTVGTGGDPPSLDPHRETTSYNYSITTSAYNGLVKYDSQAWPAMKVVSDLATGWQLSPDGKVYTFNLAKGVKFHDGAPMTAEDVKFSFERIRDPQLGLAKSPRRQQLSNVASIGAPDDSTVKITLGYPQASFLPTIAAFYTGAVMEKRLVLEKKGDMTKTIMGTGPFKFKDYTSGISFELVKNKDYFLKDRPYLDAVKGYIIADRFARFAALRTRNILWLSPFPYMAVPQAKMVEEQLSDKINLKWAFHPAWYGAAFNVARAPWSDVRVRQAVSLSFDRKKMLAVGLEGAGLIGMSGQPPSEWALPEEEMNKVPGYAKPDIEAAKKLMAEAGFPNGFRTEALVWATPVHQAFALLFKDAVAAVGITADLNVNETTVYNDLRFRKAFGVMASASGSGSTDPDMVLGDYYVTDSAQNFGGYSNPQFDELYVKQVRTLDTTERRKIVWEMQRILLRDVPIAITYWSNVAYAWWKEVRGFNPPVSFFHAFGYQEIWIAK
ncbi:MAG: ABC transporter substrate-binding protein [Chloroflexi bacterium]|nr:ABC transporter substrate-binding protein [Chloroflexota bacterium]